MALTLAMWWPCLHKWPTLWPCGDPARLYCSPDDLLWFVHLATFWTATLTPGWPLSLERPKRSAITATRDFRFGLKLDYYWQEIIFVIIVLKIRFLFVLSHRAKNKIKTNIYKFKIRSIWCQLAPNWGRIWYHIPDGNLPLACELVENMMMGQKIYFNVFLWGGAVSFHM